MIALALRPASIRVATACTAFVLIASVVAAVTYDRGLAIGDARLHTDGIANVLSPDGQQRAVRGTVRLHTGDVVEAVQGAMRVDLPDGSTVEGRPAQRDSQNTKLRIARPVELMAGDLLVTATKGTDVDAAGNRVTLARADGGESAMRVSRALAVVAGVYHGAATLDSAGQRRSIDALRQIDVSSLGRPANELRPIDAHDNDSWDRRFLGDAMDLSATLDSYVRAYKPSLTPGEGRTVGFYQQLLPALTQEAEFTTGLVDDIRAADPGSTLVGAAIASLGHRGTFTQRWRDVFTFHDQGAGWGLVALDQGVARDPLLHAVQSALNETPFQFAAGATTTLPFGVSPSTLAAGSVDGGSSGGTGTTSPGTTTPPTTLPPTTVPPTTAPPTGSPLVDGLVNDVNSLLGGVVGAN